MTTDMRPETRDQRRRPATRKNFSLLSPVSHLKSRRAFTLVEILLVVTIIGVLAAMVVPRVPQWSNKAKINRSKADISSLGVALDLYHLDVGSYPDSLDALTRREPPSGTDAEDWHGPYLKGGLRKDPWQRPYVYKKDSQHGQDYDLSSLGLDGQPSADDITNWSE